MKNCAMAPPRIEPATFRLLAHCLKQLRHRVPAVSGTVWYLLYKQSPTIPERGTAVAPWLRRCATNPKVAGSIPHGVIGNFIDIKPFRSHYGPEVDSASNRNEYQEHFLGVKAAGA